MLICSSNISLLKYARGLFGDDKQGFDEFLNYSSPNENSNISIRQLHLDTRDKVLPLLNRGNQESLASELFSTIDNMLGCQSTSHNAIKNIDLSKCRNQIKEHYNKSIHELTKNKYSSAIQNFSHNI